MLKQPMIEKLTGMRLLGMVEALKAQEQDPSARELSFLERLGLLVDQQWNWRENQALSRRLKNAKLRTPNACVEEIDYRTARGLDKSVIRSLTQESARVGTHENIFVLGPSSTGWFTMRIGSRCVAIRCERIGARPDPSRLVCV
jgi:DNA replication protein DnaC